MGVWVARTSPWSQYERALVRQLAMLKIWADNHGLGAIWRPALNPQHFEAHRWLAARGRAWDDEEISLLAQPAPALSELEGGLAQHYGWLATLDADEARWALADPRDRPSVIAALRGLPGDRLAGLPLY